MLSVHFGVFESEDYVFDPDMYFNNTYEDEWLLDPFVRDVVADVDGSIVVGPRLIDSPFLGPIPPERLSGGVKTLVLMRFDHDHVFNASACGDNCAPWILRIGTEHDLLIRLGYLMDFGPEPFAIVVANTGEVAHDIKELYDIVLENQLI